MRKFLFFFFLSACIFFTSCIQDVKDSMRTPLLEVGGEYLYQDQIDQLVSPATSTEDSIAIVDSYIQKWIVNALMYEKAAQKLKNNPDIDQLVDDYRRSLIIHKYQESIFDQDVLLAPTEEEMIRFYEQHPQLFKLEDNIIQGFLLIAPKDAPQIDEIRKWVKEKSQESLENIEKYSLLNSISYEYFEENGVSFSEVAKKLPIVIDYPSKYIAQTPFTEVSDSLKYYFLRIDSYKTIGQTEPFEMAMAKIKNRILLGKRAEYIDELEKAMLDDAQKNNKIHHFGEKLTLFERFMLRMRTDKN